MDKNRGANNKPIKSVDLPGLLVFGLAIAAAAITIVGGALWLRKPKISDEKKAATVEQETDRALQKREELKLQFEEREKFFGGIDGEVFTLLNQNLSEETIAPNFKVSLRNNEIGHLTSDFTARLSLVEGGKEFFEKEFGSARKLYEWAVRSIDDSQYLINWTDEKLASTDPTVTDKIKNALRSVRADALVMQKTDELLLRDVGNSANDNRPGVKIEDGVKAPVEKQRDGR